MFRGLNDNQLDILVIEKLSLIPEGPHYTSRDGKTLFFLSSEYALINFGNVQTFLTPINQTAIPRNYDEIFIILTMSTVNPKLSYLCKSRNTQERNKLRFQKPFAHLGNYGQHCTVVHVKKVSASTTYSFTLYDPSKVDDVKRSDWTKFHRDVLNYFPRAFHLERGNAETKTFRYDSSCVHGCCTLVVLEVIQRLVSGHTGEISRFTSSQCKTILGKMRIEFRKRKWTWQDSPVDLEGEQSNENNDRVEVEAILHKKVKDGKKFYLVKWVDLPYSENTWEDEETLNDGSDEALAEFNLKWEEEQRKRRRARVVLFKDNRNRIV